MSIHETAWLIELVDTSAAVLWWAGGEEWTPDSLRAVRFCRREDADAVASRMPDPASVLPTEHSWIGP